MSFATIQNCKIRVREKSTLFHWTSYLISCVYAPLPEGLQDQRLHGISTFVWYTQWLEMLVIFRFFKPKSKFWWQCNLIKISPNYIIFHKGLLLANLHVYAFSNCKFKTFCYVNKKKHPIYVSGNVTKKNMWIYYCKPKKAKGTVFLS